VGDLIFRVDDDGIDDDANDLVYAYGCVCARACAFVMALMMTSKNRYMYVDVSVCLCPRSCVRACERDVR